MRRSWQSAEQRQICFERTNAGGIAKATLAGTKRRAVETLLRDPEWSQWSDREIARRAAVGYTLVKTMRDFLTTRDGQLEPPPRTYTTKHGSPAAMDTSRIGRRGDSTYQMQPRAQEMERVETVGVSRNVMHEAAANGAL